MNNGSFRVRGTVRSKANEERLQPLRDAFGHYYDQLELIEADLNNESSMIEACKDTDYVVHTASPFFSGKPKNVFKDLIEPAVNGTLSVLKGCAKYKVIKCVITSSCATIYHKNDPSV